jgi:UDP-N-acetylglucosamine 4,6-dehydratase/5-epimerase
MADQTVDPRLYEPSGVDGKSVLITGGTGSFGKRFLRTVLERCRPARVIVFSRDELKQSEMAERFSPADHPALRYFLGDVRDRDRLEMALQGVDIVVHAAALKQVPAAEYNPFECIRTNVLGAENVVQAAIRVGVKKVIALSTDKAVNPINLYGASKLAADKIFVAANHLSGESGPRFSVVRYGNVVGSRGSVVPFFQKLIRQGATYLPITDPEMTRFWITLQHSAEFVLSSIGSMTGGEIFVPKIPSMRVAAMARAMAPDLPHRIVGIRPGEKLHEALITEDDARHTAEFKDRFMIIPNIRFWKNDAFDRLERVTPGFTYTSNNNPVTLDAARFLTLLSETVTENVEDPQVGAAQGA